jgi:hypothetical protein
MMTRFSPSLLRGATLSLAIALLVAGCSDPRTQVTLFVDGSAAVQSNTVTIRVEFFEPGETEPLHVELLPMTEWPVTFALVPDVADEFVAHVYALDAGNGVVAEGVAWTSFVSGSTRFYYMYLDATPCSGAMLDACAPDEFCVDGGACIQAVFTEGSNLPTTPRDGESPNPCEGVTCGTAAECVPFFGVGTCACPDGFAGDPAVECIDVCGLPSAPECGANGACAVDGDGETFCDCNFPFTGAACDGCAEGWQLNGDVCEGACTGLCGLHERCNEELTIPVCDCEVGYDLLGSDCAWVGGGFNGGGFLDGEITDPTAWFTNQVTIDENEHGAGNGVAEPELAGACGTSGIGQVIQMPPYSSAEPFVVEVGVDERGPEFECKSHPMLIVGETYQRLSYVASGTQPPDQIGTACLPVTGYGPDVPVVLVQDPLDQNGSCELGDAPFCEPYAIDSIRIRTALPGECPTPGALPNGDFSANTDWTFELNANGQAGSSGISTGAYEASLSRVCQSAQATQTVTFPAGVDLPNPALRFAVTSTVSETLQIQVGQEFRPITLAQSIGTGVLETATVCIPPWLQGTTSILRLNVVNPSALCSVVRVHSHRVDNLEFVSEPDCANRVGGLVADFEDGGANSRLVLTPQALGSGSTRYIASVAMFFDSLAWGLSDNGNSSVSATLLAQIPVDETGVQGPAIRMRYLVNNTTQGGRVRFDPSPDDVGHAGTATTTTVQSCLNREVGGQVIPIRLTFSRTGATPIFHLVDDIEVILADGC